LLEYSESIECYDKALELDPRNIMALSNKGAAVANSGNFEEAIKCFEEALKINPNDYNAQNNKKMLLEHLNR
jgi:tetratricopeptide (TPR) repeat protein